MTSTPSGARVVWRAFTYLTLLSIWNATRARLARLKQPRYALGAAIGAAYFWFVAFRAIQRPPGQPTPEQVFGLADLAPLWVALAAFALFVAVALAWIIPGSRAALQFSEAEVAFLFPAPLTRRMLIHYKLLRSQIGLLVSALLMALIFRRGAGAGPGAALYAVGWWLMLANLSLHYVAASFARERLLDFGIDAARRRVLVAALIAAVGFGCWIWIRRNLPPPAADDFDDLAHIARYFGLLLDSPPLPWLLAPFRCVVAPLFARDAAAFAFAAGPALAVLFLHYLWVIRSDTAFEEASIDLARRQAERVGAIRSGKSLFRREPSKPRPEPFRLHARGPAAVAFLWKGLIEMGAFFRPRNFAIIAALIFAAGVWMRADPARKPMLVAFTMVGMLVAIWTVLAAPMAMTQRLRSVFTRLDILKASPVDGRQIVLGELAAPTAVLTAIVWSGLLLAAQGLVAAKTGAFGGERIAIFAIAALLALPPLLGLLLCAPLASYVIFPAWTLTVGSRGGGIESAGQRMIFLAAYVLLLLAALLPGAAIGALVVLVAGWLGVETLGSVVAILAVAATLMVEFIGAVQWLGDRLDGFDLSLDQAP